MCHPERRQSNVDTAMRDWLHRRSEQATKGQCGAMACGACRFHGIFHAGEQLTAERVGLE